MNTEHTTPGAISRSFQRRIKRIKIWELEHRHHCSIVGTCLTLDEMRRFCRKAGFKSSTPVSDYQLHIKLVTMIGSNSRAARPVNKYLNNKYSSAIHCFAQAATLRELEKLWRKAVSQGDVADAYWALVTDPRVSEQLLFRIYGDVHMLSHLSGASVRLDMQALNRLRQRTPELEHELAESRAELLRRTREKDETIQALNRRLAVQLDIEHRLRETQQRLHELESGKTLAQLRSLLLEHSGKLDKMLTRAERAEAAAERWRLLADEAVSLRQPLEQQIAELAAERDTLEATLNQHLSTRISPCGDGNCDEQNSDLCKCCVLYVGGRNRQRAHFRTLVERQNGHFIHHDGGLEESGHRLAELLPKADVVLCPLDCISHDAVQRVVRHCKQHGKALKLLPKSSLAAFSRGLNEFAND